MYPNIYEWVVQYHLNYAFKLPYVHVEFFIYLIIIKVTKYLLLRVYNVCNQFFKTEF